MNILHVGLGGRGRHWLAIARTRSDVTSVGGVDPDAAALCWTRTHVPELGNACYADLDDALDRTRADAAIIATPATQRARHAIKALDAGLAVMLEMPLAGSLAEAAQVLDVARRAGGVIMVAQPCRFTRNGRELRRLVQAGKVGTITHVSCLDRRSRPASGNDLAHGDYPQLWDVAAQHFDSLRAVLAANPVSVMARCGNAPGSEYRHGSTTEALLEMDGNVHVQYHGSLTANRDEHVLWIEGQAGVLRTDGVRIWWRKRGWPVFLPIRWGRTPAGDALTHPREGTAALLQQLRAAVVDGRRPEPAAEDTLWTLSMLEAVMRSDKTEKVVGIAELLSEARASAGA
jgi:predicted dehydrogenase